MSLIAASRLMNWKWVVNCDSGESWLLLCEYAMHHRHVGYRTLRDPWPLNIVAIVAVRKRRALMGKCPKRGLSFLSSKFALQQPSSTVHTQQYPTFPWHLIPLYSRRRRPFSSHFQNKCVRSSILCCFCAASALLLFVTGVVCRPSSTARSSARVPSPSRPPL